MKDEEVMAIFKPGACRQRTWFLEITFMRTSVCVCVCVRVCVYAPQSIKNYLREMKSE